MSPIPAAVGSAGGDPTLVPASVDRPAQTARSEPPRRPTFLEFLSYVLDDPRRTRRLIGLVLTAALCIAAILFVLQLHPDRWASVLAVGTSVVAGVLGLRRRGGGEDPPEDP
jgi:hypothetical protein